MCSPCIMAHAITTMTTSKQHHMTIMTPKHVTKTGRYMGAKPRDNTRHHQPHKKHKNHIFKMHKHAHTHTYRHCLADGRQYFLMAFTTFMVFFAFFKTWRLRLVAAFSMAFFIALGNAAIDNTCCETATPSSRISSH